MNVQIDLLPSPPYDDVVVVVDILRTSTVAAVLFENDLAQLHLVTSTSLARKLVDGPEVLLIGERKGLPPEGFNYGNSPAKLRTTSMIGKSAVLVSENAPAVMPQVTGAKHVLLGSFFNAGAVVKRAADLAETTVHLVCCGLREQEDLDDSLAAGFLAAQFMGLDPSVRLSGAGRLALGLLRTFPDPLEALWRSSAGHYLRGLDQADDLAVASLINQTSRVPELIASSSYENGSVHTFTA